MQEEDHPEVAPPTEPLEGPPTVVEKPVAAGRNLKVAIVTGLSLAGLVVGLLLIPESPAPFIALAVIVILLAQAEFYVASRRAGFEPAMALGLVAGAVMLLGAFVRGEPGVGLVLFLAIVFSFIWYLALEDRSDLMKQVGVTVFGIVYVPLLGSFALLLARREDWGGVVLSAIGLAALYDVFAYAGGSRFGRTRLAPRISPNKTLEGALIATVAMMVIAPLLLIWLDLGPWGYAQALMVVIAACAAAPLGDLFESAIKRDLGIKDMGTIMPGHGGALDRIDAILFVAPVTYLALRAFGL